MVTDIAAEHRKVDSGFESERQFQMWLYDMGHKQLLLRSVKGDRWQTRVGVLFKGVESINLPTLMQQLRIERTDEGYLMSGDGWEGSVSALVCAFSEDEGEYRPKPFQGLTGNQWLAESFWRLIIRN